ncbi:MAG TPA: hypothetical protein VED01_21610 [Burkholderiales bacterium]|nr:hypothetical protein [Burkholderiales bacterium]
MPDKKTLERAARDKQQGKAVSTQAGKFVRESGATTSSRGAGVGAVAISWRT